MSAPDAAVWPAGLDRHLARVWRAERRDLERGRLADLRARRGTPALGVDTDEGGVGAVLVRLADGSAWRAAPVAGWAARRVVAASAASGVRLGPVSRAGRSWVLTFDDGAGRRLALVAEVVEPMSGGRRLPSVALAA